MRTSLAGAVGALLAALTTCLAAADEAPQHRADLTRAAKAISIIYFPGVNALPLYVAADKGIFARHGIAVELVATPNSRHLMTNVIAGNYAIGHAGIDNLIAYQEGQSGVTLDREPDLFAFMGVSSTNLSLIVQPAVTSFADLKGKKFAVDAPHTGFAFVLRKMLERGGLSEQDYALDAVGGDPLRLKALTAGTHAGALLTSDFAAQAMATGLRRLELSLDVLGRYQGTSLFASRAWAQWHRSELIGFIRAVIAAHDWIFAPDNKHAAAEILATNVKGMTLAAAQVSIDQALRPSGLARRGEIDMAGVETVLALRRQYAMPPKPLGDARQYVDLSFYEAARRAEAR